MASLIVVGRSTRREHPLDTAVTVVGRDSGANLELGDLQLSRRHALLIQASQGFFLKDLGSRNGVLINEVRVPARQQAFLHDGDVLTMGRTTLIFKEVVSALDLQMPDVVAPVAEPAPQVPAPQVPTPQVPQVPAAKAPAKPAAPAKPPAKAAVEPRHRTPTSVPATPGPARPRRRSSGSHDRHVKPSAQALTLHALIERTERDRQFFRNVSLVLFCFLILTLVGVFAWALMQRGEAQPADTAPVTEIPTAPAHPEVALDAAVFARDVQPLLAAKCAACHSQPDRGGRLRLASAQDPTTSAGNLAALAAFVIPQDPERSPLLLKPLAVASGGVEHGGGDVFTADSAEWRTLRDWVSKARVGAQTPAARILAPRQAALGHPLAFRAEAQPARGGALAFRWTLLETPADSRANLRQVSGLRTRLTPDVPGRYVVELQVREGSAVASATHSVEVGAGGEARPPTGGLPSQRSSGETPARPQDATPRIVGSDLNAVFQRCLGRKPSQGEIQRLSTAGPDAVRRSLLGEDALYARWWAQELDHLGLTGKHAPRDEPWTSLPSKLRQGRFSVADVHYALLVGQFWSERYPEPAASAKAMIERILGPAAANDPALRAEAVRLLEGHKATFLGKPAQGQVGLVRALVRSKRAATTLLQRTHFRLAGRELTKPELAAALESYQGDPRTYFSLYLGWAMAD